MARKRTDAQGGHLVHVEADRALVARDAGRTVRKEASFISAIASVQQ